MSRFQLKLSAVYLALVFQEKWLNFSINISIYAFRNVFMYNDILESDALLHINSNEHMHFYARSSVRSPHAILARLVCQQ